MSGIQMALMGSGGQTVTFNIITVGDQRVTPTVANASFRFNADGTLTYTGNTSSGGSTWVTPPPPLVTYYGQLVINSGNANTTGPASGVVTDLSTNPVWGWTCPANSTRNATCTFNVYADSGGTILRFTDNFNVSLEST